VRRTRNLWLSIGFVGVLVAASIVAWVLGTRPVLGLDLEGGVSVVLRAPEGTTHDVMERALENIRTRVDAFGVGEPILYLSGSNIEVQIPGLARGDIEERRIERFCLLDEDGTSFGCFDDEGRATDALDATSVQPFVSSACLTGGPFADQPRCYGDQKQADGAIQAMQVQKQDDAVCITGTGLQEDPCDYATRADAEAALAAITVDVREEYCLDEEDGGTLEADAGAACFGSQDAADEALASLSVERRSREYCVVSSAGRNLGCFFTRDDAESKLQETGQERLLEVIGTTARLEQRQVLETLPPGSPAYESTPVTCGDPTERDTEACSFQALRDQDVVFPGADQTKYRLGPVEITGEAIKRAVAVFGGAGQSQIPGWRIDFELTAEGTDTFGEVTQRLVGQQLAIVVDEQVISAPTVDEPITGGSGTISGSFTKNRAQDLATQLNAGALPVNLQQQQVQTVSPTLGAESLHQAVLAGIAGLVLLALYLLFYYRLLGVVAWFGMAIWAILALALVGVAGLAFGYSLTLAGVAGLVISLGVTTDSYIVFFERLKDEVRHGRSPRSAVQPAFSRSFRTIVAADIVTGIAAIVLYVTAISSVRGFALTLGVSVVLDLFIVWFFKRPTVFLIARSERLVNLPGFGLTSGVAADRLPGEGAPVVAGASR
jgi:preprotein translocase subunit SecD